MTTWRQHAACRNVDDIAIFFPSRCNTPDAAIAAAHCANCPVIADCFADAQTFGRTDGTVQGGAFWVAGNPHDIHRQKRPGPSRSELARQRRTEAFTRYLEYRNQGLTRRNAIRLIANHYDVTRDAVYDWIRKGTADASRANAAKATAGG